MHNVLLMSLVALVGCVGCSNARITSTQAHDALKGHPVLLQLEGTDQTVVIESGPTDPLYSVITSDGEFLVRDLTLAELELNHPGIHDRIESAISANHAGLKVEFN